MAFGSGTVVARATGVLDVDTSRWERGLKGAESDLSKSGKRMTSIAKGAGLAIGAGIGLAAVGIKKSVDAAMEAQKVNAQVAAVLKSTGGAAKVTARDIDALSSAMAKKTTFDDDSIKKGQALLLTFTNIRNEAGKGNDIFNQTTKIMADMATALGTDAGGSAIQLGKALNDPIKGITALTRVGVSFTEGQKETIKRLVESGDTMQAQKIILKELNREFGGSAEAAGKTFGGQLAIAKNQLGEFQESVGNAVIPILSKLVSTFMDDVVPALQSAFGWLKDKLGPAFSAIGDAIGSVVDLIRSNWGRIVDTVRGPLEAIVESVTGRLKFIWEQVKIIWEAITTVIRENWDRIVGIVRPIVEALVSIIQTRLRFLWELVKVIWEGIAGVIRDHSEQLKTIGNGIMGIFRAIGVVLKGLAVVFEFVFMKLLLPVAKLVFGKILPGVIGVVIDVIAGLIKAVTRAKDFCVNAFNFIKNGISTAVNAIKGFLQGFRDAMTRAANWVRDKAGNIVEFVKGIPGKIGNIGQLVWNKLKGGWNEVNTWIRDKLGTLTEWIKGLPKRLGDLGGAILSAITGGFKSAWNAIAGLFNRIPDVKIPDWVPLVGGRGFSWPNLPTLARGGLVQGQGEDDSVLALLTPGEAVLNKQQINRVGGARALRAAGVPGFAAGGIVLPGTSHDYARKATLGDRQIADLVYRSSWHNRARQTEGVMIVLGESSGRWSAHNPGVGGSEDSWGGWQINRKAHNVSVAQATDPEWSSGYARRLYDRRRWQPWGAWTDGRASGFRSRAEKAVEWHRKALKRAQQTGSGPSSGGGGSGGGSQGGGRPGNRPPPVSVEIAPPTDGQVVSTDPEWPGAEQNYRRLYGTYYQEDRNGRYVNFQPNAALYWRVGLAAPGPLLNVPETIEEEPGPRVGPIGSAAIGHAFQFPKWQRWWGIGTHKSFTQMAQNRGMSPKALRDWIKSNIVAAAMIGYTQENVPGGGDRWDWEPKPDKDGKDGKGDGKGDGKDGDGRGETAGAQRWLRVKKAIDEVTRIDKLNLRYQLGGNHFATTPPGAFGLYDCSSFASRVLMDAGILRPRASYVSDNFLPRGSAGMLPNAGKWITVWAHRGTGQYGHVFLEFPGGRQAESGGYGAGGGWMHRSTSGFTPSHPKGYQRGGVVPGMGDDDSVPALLTPGEVVLNREQQGRLAAILGRPMSRVLRALGVPRSRGGRRPLRAHTGTQIHFHWFDQSWSQGERSKFISAAAARPGPPDLGQQLIAGHAFMQQVFGGSARVPPGGSSTGAIHGPPTPTGAQGAPVGGAGGAPPEEYGLPPEPGEPEAEAETAAETEAEAGPSGPSAAEIEAQIQERLRREAEAIWGARSGFLRELAPNIFTQGPAGLELGSTGLRPGSPIVINSTFNQVPEDPFVWLRRVDTAAKFAMG